MAFSLSLQTQVEEPRRPLEYFMSYFPDEFFEEAAFFTNSYCLAKTGKQLNTSAVEIKQLYGAHILIGNIPYPRIRMYWSDGFKMEMIARAFSHDRFFQLRTCLHFVDTIVVNENARHNKLWKVQPVIDRVRNKCKAIPRNSRYYSVDEQMIPFTGRCPLKQYVKNKPRPVGLKNFVVTTSAGIVMDFEIYQGTCTPLPESELGLGPSIVLRLVDTLPVSSFVYFDRYFTTVKLMERLTELNMEGTGTIMNNRLKNVNFSQDCKLKRGDYEEYCRSDDKVVAVKWKDSKCVTMLSTCSGAEPVSTVKRWCKKDKKYIDVPCPSVVRHYNQSMGGVDICDQQVECYRTWVKTKKWTLKVVLHFLDLALVNAWMEYREDCRKSQVPKKNIMDLLGFRMAIAESLLATPKRKRRGEGDKENEEDDISEQGGMLSRQVFAALKCWSAGVEIS